MRPGNPVTSFVGNAFKKAVHWLASKPEDPNSFFNPYGLLPASGLGFNRAGLIVERIISLPSMLGVATGAFAATGNPLSVSAGIAGKAGSVAIAAAVDAGMKSLDKFVNKKAEDKTQTVIRLAPAEPINPAGLIYAPLPSYRQRMPAPAYRTQNF